MFICEKDFKMCFGCNTEKPLSDFYKNSARKDGHQTRCKQCFKEYGQKYAKVWRERHKDYVREYQRKLRRKWKLKAIKSLGGKCVKCGFSDFRALQIDHIERSTEKEKRRMGNTEYYKQIILESQSGKYQLLCANCNWIKRYEKGEHS